MFFHRKSEVFLDLKRILKDLQRAETDIKKKRFERAFKDLKIGFRDNKRLIHWLKKHETYRAHAKKVVYGEKQIIRDFSEVMNTLLSIREHYNQAEYEKVLELIEKIEEIIIWEIKADKRYTKYNREEVIEHTHNEIEKEIKKADTTLVKIMKKYELIDPVSYINPTNSTSEKEKFFAFLERGKVYNPQFTYKPTPEQLLSQIEEQANDAMRKLREMKMQPNENRGRIVNAKRIELQVMLKLVRNIGNPIITKYSIQMYGFPSIELVNRAKAELNQHKNRVVTELNKKFTERKYSANDVAKKMQAYLKKRKFHEWKVVIKNPNEMSARLATDNLAREVKINKGSAPFSEQDIIKVIKHEIDVHVARYEAGKKSSLQLTQYGTQGYLGVEEGIGQYIEELEGVRNMQFKERNMLFVITVQLAYRKGFYDCFQTLLSYGIAKEDAWNVLIRIKRGLHNTGQAGGFFKDHLYYLGEKQLREYIEQGGNIIKLIEAGKVSINDLKRL